MDGFAGVLFHQGDVLISCRMEYYLGMPIAEYVIYTVRIPDIAYDRYKIQFLILLLQFQA